MARCRRSRFLSWPWSRWWNDWPVSRLTTPWNGLIDTVLVVATAVVLTIAGQAVVERSDVRGAFEVTPGPGVPVTFPATLVLAAAVFTAMIQLLLVCERWPLGGLELRWSGLAALALSWAVGTSAYFIFVNLGSVPAADRERIEDPAAVAALAALLRDARPPPRNVRGHRTARPAA